MYALIVAIHAVFSYLTFLLGYNILSGIFIFLGLFFLFYFSPLFFQEHESVVNDSQGGGKGLYFLTSLSTALSPQKSILLPVILLYVALYGFLFSIFGSKEHFLFFHTIIVVGIYAIFGGYMLAFSWKEEMFFSLFRYHTLFTLSTSIFLTIYTVFSPTHSYLFLFIISVLGLICATFFLWFHSHESSLFIYSYLLAGLSFVFLIFSFLFPDDSIFGLIGIYIIGAMALFEKWSSVSILSPYTVPIRYFSLALTILITPILIYTSFSSMTESVIFLSFLSIFFLSIHTRYTNLITYITGLILIYFIYSLLFFGLVQPWQIFSVALFLFFLPLTLIGITYFIPQTYEYDFTILHYSAIAFSVIYSLYVLLFIGWGADLLFMISLCVFGVALLFFLSYFRFRSETRNT